MPGTAAAALRAAGRWTEPARRRSTTRTSGTAPRLSADGRESLRFEGLATLAEIWLDGDAADLETLDVHRP